MRDRTLSHSEFTIERIYDAHPNEVFEAWATAEAKSSWFGANDESWKVTERTFEFKVGGQETLAGQWTSEGQQLETLFDAVYHEIVDKERIVYSYAMLVDGTRISVSLASVEFLAQGQGTQMIYTEQMTIINNGDTIESRKRGTESIFDALSAYLNSAA